MASLPHGLPRRGGSTQTAQYPYHQHHASFHPPEPGFVHHQVKRLKDDFVPVKNIPSSSQMRVPGHGAFPALQQSNPGFQEWIPTLGSAGPRRAMTSAFPESYGIKEHMATKNGWVSDSELMWSPAKRRSVGRPPPNTQPGEQHFGGVGATPQSRAFPHQSRMRELFEAKQPAAIVTDASAMEKALAMDSSAGQSKSEPSSPVDADQQKRKKKRPKRRPNERRREKSRRWIEAKKMEKESRRLETERQLESLIGEDEEEEEEDSDNELLPLPHAGSDGQSVVITEESDCPVLKSAPLPVQRELPVPDPEQEALFAATALGDAQKDRILPLRRASTLPIGGSYLRATPGASLQPRDFRLQQQGMLNPRNQSQSPERDRTPFLPFPGPMQVRFDADGFKLPPPVKANVPRADFAAQPTTGLPQTDVRDFAFDHSPTMRGGLFRSSSMASSWQRSHSLSSHSPRSGWTPSTGPLPSPLNPSSHQQKTVRSNIPAALTVPSSSSPTTSPPLSPSSLIEQAQRLFIQNVLPGAATAPIPNQYPRHSRTEPTVSSEAFKNGQPASPYNPHSYSDWVLTSDEDAQLAQDQNGTRKAPTWPSPMPVSRLPAAAAYNPISNTMWTLSSEEEVQLAQEQNHQTHKAPTWPAPRPVGKQGGLRGESFL